MDLKESLKINPEETTNRILEFIRRTVEASKTSGVVIGLSGGVDSSLVAALCVKTLGKDKVLGVLIPTNFTPKEDIKDALELAENMGIRTETINIYKSGEAIFRALRVNKEEPKMRIPTANILARIRMTILYYYANINNYLVVGTGDRSESLIGYFTKYGDGGADLLPIRHLYKTQVRELARYLGILEKIVSKSSSPQLYPGHKATDEIPIDYDKLDLILAGLFDCNLSPEDVSQITGFPLKTIREVQERFHRTKHKREYPLMITYG